MARLWSTGFELGSATGGASGIEWNLANTGSPSISSSIKRSGSYSLRTNPTSSTSYISHDCAYVDLSGTIHFRFYLYIATAPSATTTIFRAGSTTDYLTIRLTSGRQLQFFGGTTQLGSNSSTLNTGQWYRVEIEWVTGSSKTQRARLDGSEFASGTYTSSGFNGVVRIGVQNATTADLYFDDIGVNDDTGTDQNSWLGDGKIVCIRPDGAGDNNNWLKSGGGAGDANNYTEVDEITPDNATTYLKTTTNNVIDDYNCQNTSDVGIASGSTITLIHVGVRYYSALATSSSVKARIKPSSGGSVTTGADLVATANNTWYSFTSSTTNSGYGRYSLTVYGWSVSDVDSMQIGIQSNVTFSDEIRVSTVWAMVEYVPAGATTYTITKSLQYAVKTTPASISKSLKYTVKTTPTSISKSLSYKIVKATTLTKSIQYAVKATPSVSKSLKYTVKTTPTSISKSLKYTIKTTPSAISKSLQYAIKKVNQLTKQLKYTVISSPSIAKQLKYTVKTTPSSISKSLSYAVKPSFSISKSLKYTVKTTPTAISKQVKYAVKTTPSAVSKTLQYLVKTTGSVSKSLQYAVRASPSISKSLKYTVKATPTAIAKSLSYKVVRAISVSKSLQYAVKATTSFTKQLKYTVKTTFSVSKALKYTVVVSPSISKQLKYAIKTTPAISKGLQYLVRATNSLTRPLKYTVKTSPSLDKTLSYAVKTSSSIQKSLSYEVYTGVTTQTITKSLKYSVCVIDNAVYPKWIFVDGNLAMRVKGKHYTKV